MEQEALYRLVYQLCLVISARQAAEMLPAGSQLLKELYRLNRVEGLPLTEVADKLCISYGYARKLSSRIRREYETNEA